MSTVNSTSVSPSMSPNSLGHAPKFGTRVPNRVFVGGISSNTTEAELYELFATYGEVRATKIIADRAGVSKGYGFVTFATDEEAEGILKEENVMLKDRKLNIAPAIRKQAGFYPLSRYFGSQDMGSDTTGSSARLTPRATPEWSVSTPEPAQVYSNGTVFYHNGTPYVYPTTGGPLIFATAGADGTCQYTQPAQVSEAYYPVMYSPTIYLPPQQYQYPSPTTAQSQWTGQQMRWAAQVNYGQNPCPQASATSAHHYVYTTNGSPASNTASVKSTSSASSLVPLQQQQQQQLHQQQLPKGAAGDSISVVTSNGCSSAALAYAPTHVYASLPPLAAYQHQHAMTSPPQPQDYVDTPPPQPPTMIENMMSTAEPPPSRPHQDSMGNTDSRGVAQVTRHTSTRFARPPPSYYQGGCPNSEGNYRPAPRPYEQQQHHSNNSNHISNSSTRGYHRNRSGGGGGQYQSSSTTPSSSSYGNPRHNSSPHNNNNNNRPRFNYKSMTPYSDNLLNQNKCILTPPKTPMAGDASSSMSDASLTDAAAKKLEALTL